MTEFPAISSLQSLNEVDKQAQIFASSMRWGMGAFIAVFSPSLDEVLLVKTGDYAKDSSGGTPWNLPGGAVEPGEMPSHAALRELEEETGLSNPTGIRIVAWFARPYFKSRHRETPGELISLFAGIDRNGGRGLRPAPPEIEACGFHHFDLEEWLRVPARGKGEHPLSPLPRHWIYWTRIAQRGLKLTGIPIFTHEYLNSASMAIIPDALKSRL
jgi:ADP-ribose pyrophosphatase YjhB (NUDIX family)